MQGIMGQISKFKFIQLITHNIRLQFAVLNSSTLN